MDIFADGINFSYEQGPAPALKNVSFQVRKGEFIAIIGANGSGKSTLARHLNALLELQEGRLSVLGKDVSDENNIRGLRRGCGMVFQDPDSQFVSSVVGEDVAFGPYCYDEANVGEKVRKALETVGMEEYENRSPYELSGGQKQRIAIAGVIALSPQIVVFDEATSMIDPEGRRETLGYLKKINSMGKTVIMITHFTEEAAAADRVFVMSEGEIIKTGPPREVLSDEKTLEKAGLKPPFAVEMYLELMKNGIKLGSVPLDPEELAEEICRLN